MGWEEWREGMREGGMLDRSGYKEGKVAPQWEGDGVGARVLARLRRGMVDVRGNVFREKMGKALECMGCRCGDRETVEHWLWECKMEVYEMIRTGFERGGGELGDTKALCKWGIEDRGPARATKEAFLAEMWAGRMSLDQD